MYLAIAVAALGLLAYVFSYFPLFMRPPAPSCPRRSCLTSVCRGAPGGVDRRCRPAAEAESRTGNVGGPGGTGLPAGTVTDRRDGARRDLDRVGAVPDHGVQRCCRPSSPSWCCCSTPVSSLRLCRGPSTSHRAVRPVRRSGAVLRTASSARVRRTSSTSSLCSVRRLSVRSTAAATPPARLRATTRPAGRSADTAHRVPGVRPAAVEQRRIQAMGRRAMRRRRRFRRQQSPAQPASSNQSGRRRRNLSRACVNFARVS